MWADLHVRLQAQGLEIVFTMKFLPFRLFLCFAMSSEVFADPTLLDASLCELRTLKLNTVASAFPDEISARKFSRKEPDNLGRYTAVKPYALVKWVEVSFYQKTLELKSSPAIEKDLKDWFASASWKDDDNEVVEKISFAAPLAVMVLKDESSTTIEWILEVWDIGARLSVAHACGANSYQLHPDSKQTIKLDKRLASDLLKWVSINQMPPPANQ